ncbi:asparaginase [Colletotrichum orchidophilum]|uniref:asparaginase n=1 Tax=Colletotrichum orchidophilum TaxID=1209926 RepID=A0A1G4BFM5_9PEZI|nr:asparaginase [Colletotrichum orchidophilum]OHF00189.1 asparaginase [Colletotrichum orchidophilum]
MSETITMTANIIAFIPTGGTIGTRAFNKSDLDYGSKGHGEYAGISELRRELHVEELADDLGMEIQVEGVEPLDSTAITSETWHKIAERCEELSQDARVRAIVISHGTASLEETAFTLSLVLRLRIPVIITGSMRPFNGESSDAEANLTAAFRVGARTYKKSPGVLVVFNKEIHLPRYVTKTHTGNLDAFKSPDSKPIGTVNDDKVSFDQDPLLPEDLGFRMDMLKHLPKVDIVYSSAGNDGTQVKESIKRGVKGIVSAGFAPGLGTPGEEKAFAEARLKGIIVVQSSRVLSGEVVDSEDHKAVGIIAAGNLSPQAAKILLSFSLARKATLEKIGGIFSKI